MFTTNKQKKQREMTENILDVELNKSLSDKLFYQFTFMNKKNWFVLLSTCPLHLTAHNQNCFIRFYQFNVFSVDKSNNLIIVYQNWDTIKQFGKLTDFKLQFRFFNWFIHQISALDRNKLKVVFVCVYVCCWSILWYTKSHKCGHCMCC